MKYSDVTRDTRVIESLPPVKSKRRVNLWPVLGVAGCTVLGAVLLVGLFEFALTATVREVLVGAGASMLGFLAGVSWRKQGGAR